MLELLATTACTSYSNSLSESVRFLESQLQAERHRSAVLWQEAEGLRKSLEHSDAYFLVQQQALEDFSAKYDKANQLAKLIASMVDTQDNVSWALLKLFQLCSCFATAFICTSGQFWRPSVCNMLLCSLYLHWWRILMPSGCNMCNSRNSLVLVACLFISLLSCLVVCL